MGHKTAVVTVNYRSAKDTALLLTSLSKADPPPEVVVVDNSANTELLEPYLPDYPLLTLIKSKDNIGFGRGNNLGIQWLLKHKQCDYIFLVNNDAVVLPDTISKLEAEMDADRLAGIAAPRIRLMDAPEKLWYGGGHVDWFRGKAKTRGFLGPAATISALQNRHVSFASGCGMLIRRTVFEKIGGFDPRFFMYEEDLELCLRVLGAGWLIRYCPAAQLFHKLHGAQPYRSKAGFIPSGHPDNPNLPFFLFNMLTNRLLTMSLHARGIRAVAFTMGFPLFFIYDILRYAAARRFDAFEAMAKAVIHFLRIRKRPYINELDMDMTHDCTIKQSLHT